MEIYLSICICECPRMHGKGWDAMVFGASGTIVYIFFHIDS